MKKKISIEEYHSSKTDSGETIISKSKLDLIDQSMFHFLNPEEYTSKSMDFGSALHDAILLPDLFAKKYIQAPENHDGRLKAGKDLVAQCKELGQTLVSHHEFAGILSVRDRLYKNKITRNIFNYADPETSYFTEMEVEGRLIPVKCRPDALFEKTIFDIKTTRDASEKAFKRSIEQYRYFVQAPFYKDVYFNESGNKTDNFAFILVENFYPYAIGLRLLDRESEDFGRLHYKANLKTYKRYLDNPVPLIGYEEQFIETGVSSFFLTRDIV